MINTGDYVVQQTYLPEDAHWYVHEVALMDMGRFSTEQDAEEHKKFLIEEVQMIIREDIREVDNLLMKIVTNDEPKLNDYELTIITQALEVFKESLEDNGEE